MIPSDASGADLVGLISSFLPPPSSDADGSPPQPSSDATDEDIPSAPNARTEQESVIPRARIIIFSKDRPWQLRELLRSMKLGGGAYPGRFRPSNSDINIILRASTAAFARGYDTVVKEYEGMQFLIEDETAEGMSFSSLLDTALMGNNDCKSGDASNDGIVMFLTDDCLFLEPLEVALACATGALSNASNAFNFLTRLHPGISWCQTRDAPNPPPRDEMRFHSLARYLSAACDNRDCNADVHEGVYFYDRRQCTGEWAYAFDLSGGVYRRRDVVTLLGCMASEDRSHPNILEMRANQLLTGDSGRASPNGKMRGLCQSSLSAVPTRPLMLILAINRVQDVFRAPLATPPDEMVGKEACGKSAIDPRDPESLLGLLDDDCHLDIAAYKNTLYNSSHVGDFFLEHAAQKSQEDCSPVVSVLIPVHRGPPTAARHAFFSIMMQSIEEGEPLGGNSCAQKLSPIQIVVVDDRCSDGSIDEMLKACHELAKAFTDVSFALQDFRLEENPSPRVLNDGPILISLDIVQSPRSGVAAALNHGLKFCRADLVARMDADDIAAPGRLETQLKFMRANPSFDVVGTSAALFAAKQIPTEAKGSVKKLPYSEIANNDESYCVLRPSLPLSDAGFLAWAMHFTCSLVHPSVVFRKNAVLELGGYDETISRCEDYDLWLRMLNLRNRSVVCVPFVGLWHRKHGDSSSAVGSATQKEEADKVCCRAMERLLVSSSDRPLLDQVSTLRNPSSAQSPDSLDLSAQLLQRLEASFLEKNSEHLTAREVALIRLDCNERIGELATILVTKFGPKADVSSSFVWTLWSERCPEKQLERLSLLCHTAKRSEAKQLQ